MSKIKKRLKRISVLLTILFFSSTLFFLFSGKFAISKVTILGQAELQKDRILSLANIDMSKNIYLTDIKKTEQNIMSGKYIKSAKVTRKFPSELIISVNEYVPVASVPVAGGYVIIDQNAFALSIVQKESDIKKPLISGIKIENVKLKETLPVKDKDELENILEIINYTSSLNLLENISYINLEKYDDITMTTNIGIVVKFGNLNDLQYKMKLLEEILLDLSKKGKTKGTIDMRYDTDPFFYE